MRKYILKTDVTEEGKIILPEELKKLKHHKVKVKLIDLGENNNTNQKLVEFLDKITKRYIKVKEEEINITEIYNQRKKINEREISFT